MKYRVRWSTTAENELANIWLRSTDRAAVTQAAQIIDTRLAVGAPGEGESRADELRILFAAPLGATFEVHDDKGEVDVLHVWRYRVN